jgi:hypothetical protein
VRILLEDNTITMSDSTHKKEKNRIKADEIFVRRILTEWDPIPGSPDGEYDCLVHHILSVLHHGVDQADLVSVIKNEMINHFGVEEPDANIARVADKISKWWSSKS